MCNNCNHFQLETERGDGFTRTPDLPPHSRKRMDENRGGGAFGPTRDRNRQALMRKGQPNSPFSNPGEPALEKGGSPPGLF